MSQQTEFMPFTRPSMTEEECNEVVACLQSGWITTGPRVQAFEQAVAAYCVNDQGEQPQALALSSATAGLTLVCQALLQPGDEVITTPLTFVATANSIALAGARPVFVDIDPNTFNMDLNLVEAAITEKTKAIMPVHFAGLPVDCDPLYELANKYGLRVIEDAAHAIGTSYRGRKIGSFGDIQVFSFHPNKNMTSGEGGMVICRDETLAQQLKLQRFHGIDRESWNRFTKKGSQEYDVVAPGYKYNMMDIQAAIGLIQLRRLPEFNQRRAHLASRYTSMLRGSETWQLPAAPSYPHQHAWHMYNLVLRPEVSGVSREAFIEAMKAKNIGIGLHYQAVHLFSYYQKQWGYAEGDFPHAERVAANIVSLPLFPELTEADQDRVCQEIGNEHQT